MDLGAQPSRLIPSTLSPRPSTSEVLPVEPRLVVQQFDFQVRWHLEASATDQVIF